MLTLCLISASFETNRVAHGQNTANASSISQTSAAGGGSTFNATTNPTRIQEGFNTTITVEAINEIANTTATLNVTVTDPSGASYATELSITINGTGFGSNSTQYWGSFTGGANTKYVGVYMVSVNNITTNETLANTYFTVGLTDKSEYRKTEVVQILAVGYYSNENVTMTLKVGNASVAGFPKSLFANNVGVLAFGWGIPSDATPGEYQVELNSAMNQTDRTVKSPADQDAFTVLGGICSIRTVNLADQTVADAIVEVYNATSNVYLNLAKRTNSSGWAIFNLDQGNYTFKAFFRDVEVGSLPNKIIIADNTFTIQLRLVNIVTTAETAAKEKVQSITVDLKYNYTRRDNTSLTQTESLLTNTTGMAEFRNLLTNITYRVNAKRYDLLFHNTTLAVDFDPTTPWISLQLTLPDNRLNLRVFDSKRAPAVGVLVKIYEFSETILANPLQSFEIDSSGFASSVFPFGRYRVRAFEDDLFLSEAIVNLVNDPTDIDFNLETANLEVTVSVYDYFGGPLANAEVRIERGNNNQYVFVENGFTGSDGSVTFPSIIGGDSRVFIYLAGRPVAVATQFLASGSNRITFRLNEYVAVFGFAFETGMFALTCFILVLIVVFLVLMRGRLARTVRRRGGG